MSKKIIEILRKKLYVILFAFLFVKLILVSHHLTPPNQFIKLDELYCHVASNHIVYNHLNDGTSLPLVQ